MNKCFVIQPFDGGIYDARAKEVYFPAIREGGLVPYRVDHDKNSVDLRDSIHKNIEDSVLCLAEISVVKPNVYYEIGYAMAKGKNVIIIAEQGTKLEFDISVYPVIFYKTDNLSDFDKLKNEIVEKIKFLVGTTKSRPVSDELGELINKGLSLAKQISIENNTLKINTSNLHYS